MKSGDALTHPFLTLDSPGGSIIAILSSEAIGYNEKRLADKKKII